MHKNLLLLISHSLFLCMYVYIYFLFFFSLKNHQRPNTGMQHLQHIFQMILQKEEQNPRKPREIGKFGNKRRLKCLCLVYVCLRVCLYVSLFWMYLSCVYSLHAPVISYCSFYFT